MDIEFDREAYIRQQKDYMFYMEHKAEIHEIMNAKRQGKLFIEAPRQSGQSMVDNQENTPVEPEIIDETESIFLRCSRVNSYDPDGEVRKIP